MQMLRAELERAQVARAAALDQRAQDALDGVILTLEWAIEDGGCRGPAAAAADYRTDPLDHDHDGKAGGSFKGKLATARKRRR